MKMKHRNLIQLNSVILCSHLVVYFFEKDLRHLNEVWKVKWNSLSATKVEK